MSKSKKNYVQAINKYNKEQMKLYSVRFHRRNQADIIAHLDSQPNKAGYIAGLIRDDMERKSIPTLKKLTIADIMDEIEDIDDVMLIYPDKSSLLTTKEKLKEMQSRVVEHYRVDLHVHNKMFVIEVRYS